QNEGLAHDVITISHISCMPHICLHSQGSWTRLMENRKPFRLQNTLVLYNAGTSDI
ncbi:hypothetical protein DOY81_009379, partial [Sarcophaga bullata]